MSPATGNLKTQINVSLILADLATLSKLYLFFFLVNIFPIFLIRYSKCSYLSSDF